MLEKQILKLESMRVLIIDEVIIIYLFNGYSFKDVVIILSLFLSKKKMATLLRMCHSLWFKIFKGLVMLSKSLDMSS